MKKIVDAANNRTIYLACRGEVQLPDLGDDVEVTYLAANDLIEIRCPSTPSTKLIPCADKDALIKALTAVAQTKPQTKAKTKTNSKKQTEDEPCDNSGILPVAATEKSEPCDNSGFSSVATNEKADNDSSKAADFEDIGKFTVDLETGEVIELSRDYDGLRRSYNRQKRQVLNCAPYQTTRWSICTTDTKPTYDQMNKLATAFTECLKDHYGKDNVMNFKFLEPCEDGSWHSNFLTNFINGVPSDFEDFTKKWWRRKNTKDCDEQVVVKDAFESVDDLLRVLDYLNPTSKKKRHLIKYYPKGCQPMRHSGGNVTEPNKATITFEVAKTILGKEKPERRTYVEVEQTDTKFTLYTCSTFLFVANLRTENTSDSKSDAIANDGKTDWFTCKHNDGKYKCDTCPKRETCNKRDRCEEHCIGFDTRFCRGCIWCY